MASPSRGLSAGTTFVVMAERCPQVLLRMLNLFAQQNLVVDHVVASASRRSLRAMISVRDLDEHRAAIIAEKMRQLVMVRALRVRHSQV